MVAQLSLCGGRGLSCRRVATRSWADQVRHPSQRLGPEGEPATVFGKVRLGGSPLIGPDPPGPLPRPAEPPAAFDRFGARVVASKDQSIRALLGRLDGRAHQSLPLEGNGVVRWRELGGA